MKVRKCIIGIALIAILLVTLTLSITGIASADAGGDVSGPSAYAVVDGKTIPITEGTVLGKAEDGLAICFRLDASYNRGHVEGECVDGNFVVTKVTFWHAEALERPAPILDGEYIVTAEPGIDTVNSESKTDVLADAASPLSATEMLGWAKSTVLCPFGVTSTEVYAEMSYWDNGSSVYGGHNDYHRWYWNSTFGMYLINRWWGWGPNGPSNVYTWTQGEFDCDLPRDQHHTHFAEFSGLPGQQGQYYFWISRIPDYPVWPLKFTWHTDGALSPK